MFKISNSKHVNFVRIYKYAERQYGNLPLVKKHKKRKRIYKFFKIIIIAIIAFFILATLYAAINFVNLKLIYNEAMAGKNHIEYAVWLSQNKSYELSSEYALNAREHFSLSLEGVREFKESALIARLPIIENYLENGVYLLSAAEVLSQAVEQGAKYSVGLKGFFNDEKPFSQLSSLEKRKILQYIHESGPEIIGIKANIDLAIINLETVSFKIMPWIWQDQIHNKLEKFIGRLKEAQTVLDQAIPMSQLLPAILGYPEKTSWLVVLQNSDELRPTGGFIGTYGILEALDGEIIRFDTHDIYHMDMPVKDLVSVMPPKPISKYLGINKWYMRDANWSPDWPTSAKKIDWFYKLENKLLLLKNKINNFDGEFNGVIAITPKFITDLLKITGPLKINEDEYTKENFKRLLEYKVEKEYELLGVPSWQRKEVIGDIVKKLKQVLFDQPITTMFEVFGVIDENLNEKNILLYFNDKSLQNLAEEQDWAGNIISSQGDYLMVVDSNMASFKTDAVMSKMINYNIDQGINGLFANLTVRYAHQGGFDWRTTRYRTYTRVYVPIGSQLIEFEGAEVSVYNEFDKTVFGYFISIEPGKIGSVSLRYKLPDSLAIKSQNNEYELYIQKQPGNSVGYLSVDLKLLNSIKSYKPTGFNVYRSGSNQVKWEEDLRTDRYYKVKTQF